MSAYYNFLHPCAFSIYRFKFDHKTLMHCAISKVHPAMHQCTDAPHTSSASSQNCIAELFTKMSSSHHEHPQNYFASAPSGHQPSIACAHHHRCAGQDDESLKFCNGPGRPSQDGHTKNLQCNIGCFITRIFTIANIIIRLQIIIDESLAMLVSEMGWPMFDDF